MKNLTPELIVKAKAARCAQELFEIAKANNVELTDEEAKTYFEQLNTNDAVSDDELDAVAGGCGEDEEEAVEKAEESEPTPAKKHCHYCKNLLPSHVGRCPVCMQYQYDVF